MATKYPHLKVPLVGEDGNAFFIIGRVTQIMRDARIGPDDIKIVVDDMTSGDYNHLLRVVMDTFDTSDDEGWDDEDDDYGWA